MTEQGKRFLLLQLNDALFPIGGYSHSYGLETYIQKGLVKDKEGAAVYIRNNLLYSLCQNELLAIKLAYEIAEAGDRNISIALGEFEAKDREAPIALGEFEAKDREAPIALGEFEAKDRDASRDLGEVEAGDGENFKGLVCREKEGRERAGESEFGKPANEEILEKLNQLYQLDELVTASRVSKEVRLAGEKLGSRFLKTVKMFPIAYENPIFPEYASKPYDTPFVKKSHTVAYGVFCAGIGIRKDMALEHYLYAQTSAIVTNCVKTIPLSQTVGQELLFACQEIWPLAMDKVFQLSWEDYGQASPGFEIRCMQHEGLYSRIYMS